MSASKWPRHPQRVESGRLGQGNHLAPVPRFILTGAPFIQGVAEMQPLFISAGATTPPVSGLQGRRERAGERESAPRRARARRRL